MYHNNLHQTSFLVFLLFCVALTSGTIPSCQNFVTLIKNPSSGLVLTTENNQIRVQNFTKSITQLWKLRTKCDGTHVIISTKNYYVLDKGTGNNVVINRAHGNLNQKWYINSDGTIVNVNDKNLALQVNPDNNVTVGSKNGASNQIFEFSCFCYVCPSCYFRICC